MLFADYRATDEQDWGSIERDAYQSGNTALASAARLVCDAEEKLAEADDFRYSVFDAVRDLDAAISQAKRIGNREEITKALSALQAIVKAA